MITRQIFNSVASIFECSLFSFAGYALLISTFEDSSGKSLRKGNARSHYSSVFETWIEDSEAIAAREGRAVAINRSFNLPNI